MTETLFVLIPLCSAVSIWMTEILKDVAKAMNWQIASNVKALISSVITATVVVLAAGSSLGFTTPLEYIASVFGCALITWLGSCTGYDKIKQLLEQIEEIKNGR